MSLSRKAYWVTSISVILLTAVLVVSYRWSLSVGFVQLGWGCSILAALAISLAFGAAVLLVIKNRLLSRLVKLSNDVQRIGASGDISLRVSLQGQDELGKVADEINLTLENLEKTQLALRESEEHLRHDAMHDPLTGLPNRSYFMDQLKRANDRVKRHSEYHAAALLLIDLDRFKLVNDSLGLSCGDQVLVGFARRLEACLRAEDIIARFSGDEFVTLLEDINGVSDAIRIANRIQHELIPPFRLNENDVFLTSSIGIAMITPEYDTPGDVLRDADTAMNQAKSNGKACYQVYDNGMHLQTIAALQLETELRHALERGEFELYYQPIVNLEDGKVTTLEALIRWKHPQRGLVLPGDFIPLAEETGLIVSIGEWTLRAACEQAKSWHDAGRTDLRLSVNVSARQLYDESLPGLVKDVLEQTGFPGESLQLEITESASMHDVELTVQILNELKMMDVHVTIDDFGTSYSSIGYLKRFPIDSIKIDRSFIRDITESVDDGAIIAAMIAMGHVLNRKVVAEGVETVDQLDFLVPQLCDEVQGFLLSRPLPYEQITRLLQVEGSLIHRVPAR